MKRIYFFILLYISFFNPIVAQQMDYYRHINQAEELFVLNHEASVSWNQENFFCPNIISIIPKLLSNFKA
jgi:hypothetical protein